MEYIIAMGASNVEWGFSSTWLSRLAHHYSRRASVINTGQRGYNSRWLLAALRDPDTRPVLLPPLDRPPLFVTVLLGTNDLSLPCTGQHVPVEEFVANMREIVRLVLRECRPRGGVFVLTAPPVDEAYCKTFPNLNSHTNYYDTVQPAVNPGGGWPCNHLFADSCRYRDALLRGLEGEEGVTVVDIHSAMLRYGEPSNSPATAFRANAPWTRLLVDGIHFTGAAGELVCTMLLQALRDQGVVDPDNLPLPLPEWDQLALKGKEDK